MECLETCPVTNKTQQDAVIDATIKAAVGHGRPEAQPILRHSDRPGGDVGRWRLGDFVTGIAAALIRTTKPEIGHDHAIVPRPDPSVFPPFARI
jgi:hypothetical protein